MNGLALALAAVAVAGGAAVQGVVGFGASLFAVPFLLLIEPRLVPGPATIGGMILNVLMLLGHRAHTDRRGLAWIVVGMLPGTALAGFALAAFNHDDLAILSGAAILVAVGLSAFGRTPGRAVRWLVSAGVLSGFMGTTAAVSGPPLALLYQHEDGPTIRGTLPPAFLVGAIVTLITLAAAGRLPASDWAIGAALAPASAAGFLLTRRVAHRVRGGALRAAVLAISATSALAAIVRAVW